jgi:twinkle protein
MGCSGFVITAVLTGAIFMSEKVDQWLEKRGLDPELADKMGWGLYVHQQLGATVKIPYMRNGKVVTSQYRALDKKEFRFASGSEAELWNVDVLSDTSLDQYPLIIAEGACDGLALIQSGFHRTVAVPGWSDKNFDADNYEPFKRNEERIKRAKRIIVAQHADNAGAAMVRAVTNLFSECNVAYTTWPKGCKDANDCLLMYGQEAVTAAVTTAKDIDPPGGLITGFTDLPPLPNRSIWKLDIPALDKLMAFRSREISVLTGTPGSGKTTFITWVAHHLVRANDIRVGMGLFETDSTEVLTHLIKLRVPGNYVEDERIEAEKVKLDRNFRLLHRVDDESQTAHSLGWLKAMIWKLAVRDHCKLIIIDPWNELEHEPAKGESVTAYTNYALTRMRQWAEKLDIHICIVAHPRKLARGERPDGYSVSDSAAWFNKVGTGWTVHQEDDERGEHVSVSCWKVRNRQATSCKPGRVRLEFDENAMVYRELKT